MKTLAEADWLVVIPEQLKIVTVQVMWKVNFNQADWLVQTGRMEPLYDSHRINRKQVIPGSGLLTGK